MSLVEFYWKYKNSHFKNMCRIDFAMSFAPELSFNRLTEGDFLQVSYLRVNLQSRNRMIGSAENVYQNNGMS